MHAIYLSSIGWEKEQGAKGLSRHRNYDLHRGNMFFNENEEKKKNVTTNVFHINMICRKKKDIAVVKYNSVFKEYAQI